MSDAPGLRTPSLRRRLTLVVLALVAGVLLVLAVTTDLVLRERLEGQLRDRLVDRAGVAEALVDQVDERDLVRRLEGDGVSVVLTTPDGEAYAEGALAGRAVAPRPTDDSGAEEGPQLPAEPVAPGAVPTPGGQPPAVPTPLDPPDPAAEEVQQQGDLLSVTRELPGGDTLVLLADAASVRETAGQVRLVLLLTAALVLLLTAALVPVVVGRALAPLGRITGVAGAITRGDRGRRLRPVSAGTDLGRTAVAFDEMLDAVVGAEDRARDSEQRLRDFVSDAAHELRTPVAAVQASAEHLLRESPPRAEREEVLVGLIRQTRTAGRMVDDLLTMAHIDRGLQIERADVDLRAVGDEVAAAAQRLHPGTDVAVSGAATVRGDARRLVQVVGNLVDNAARAGARSVRVAIASTPYDATLDVRDDGPGVPEAERERVFDRLHRLDASRARYPGSGLGLPIARGIAESHGGRLECLPDGGRGGAHFRLTLPGPVGHA